MLLAGFASADITPPRGAAKIGNLSFHVGARADGPLKARVTTLHDGHTRLVIAGLDALSVGARVVARIRAALPGSHTMVAATHTHGSGALVRCGVVEADADYQDRVVAAVQRAANAAIEGQRPAELATAPQWKPPSLTTGASSSATARSALTAPSRTPKRSGSRDPSTPS